MPLSFEQLNQVLSFLEKNNFSEAANSIAYRPDTSDIIRYKIEDFLRKLPSPISSSTINNIGELYGKYNNNLTQLEDALENILTDNVTDLKSQKSGPIILKDLKQLTNDQISGTIEKIRSEQNKILSQGKEIDPILAEKLQLLLKEKTDREMPGYGGKLKLDDNALDKKQNASPEAIKNWFVLPSSDELEKSEDVIFVVGSPIIGVLRKRYLKENKARFQNIYRASEVKIPNFSTKDLSSMTAEQQYEAQKEINRQKDFFKSYKDSAQINNQDIFVGQVSSEFNTDKYPTVESVTAHNTKNDAVKRYVFGSDGENTGYVDLIYDTEKRCYNIEVLGDIPGRLAIAIKRRTKSGRIMEGAFDIVELQDGQPIFHSYSSKGNTSIKDYANNDK